MSADKAVNVYTSIKKDAIIPENLGRLASIIGCSSQVDHEVNKKPHLYPGVTGHTQEVPVIVHALNCANVQNTRQIVTIMQDGA